MDIVIFFVILAAICFIARFAASKMYDKIHEAETQEIEQKKQLKASQAISPEIMGAIIAAISEVIDKPIKVRTIQFINREMDQAWTRAGRLNIMSSHQIH